jgi:putative ATP-dependent endonuclease of the OLD family
MHLKNVDIKNFRSIKELRVDLESGLNVIVGRNNTGKTNPLHSIRLAVGQSASSGDTIWLDRDDFFRKSAEDDPESMKSITLTFSGLTETQRAYCLEIVDFDLSSIANSTAVIRMDATWPKDKRHSSIMSSGGPKILNLPEVAARILESLPITFLRALRDAEEPLTPGCRSRLAALLRDVAARKNPLTPDMGIPALGWHLQSVVALMRALSGWPQFERILARPFPKCSEQFPLALHE